MTPLYMLTAVDVRRADQANSTRKTIIDKMTIPALNWMTATHTPGGGVMSADFVLPRIEAPEPAFSVKGIDLDIFSDFGIRSRWTFAGAYTEKRQNKVVPARGIIEGAIGTWEPDESDPAEFQGCTHAFKEVTHFEFLLDGKERFYVDLWENILRVDGTDIFADHRRALGA